ncbi:MAG TPA: universal stress protein [Gemmataceae bacterium]|nr:universal stress protein [Gemmataceae bacterium]
MLSIRTILVPTDFSERSGHAFRLACSLARDHGARVVVLYVQRPDVVCVAEYATYAPDPIRTPADVKEKLCARQAIDPDVVVECRVAEGDPAAAIVHAAKELDADLIVMGTHGRRGLARLLLGSVADAVCRKSPCPMLKLKPPFPVPAAESAAVKGPATV